MSLRCARRRPVCFLLRGCAGDAIVGLGDVVVLVALLVLLLVVEVERLKIERRLDAAIGVGLGLLDHRLALILQLWRPLRSRRRAFRHQKPRLILAPVCMATCMAAPSEALAHSLGSSGARRPKAISEEVVVPQAKNRSEVPAMRNRSPATKDAAAAGSTPMNSAPVMNRSPRMPPRPLGSGQLFGWGRAERAAASKSTASRPDEEARAAPFRHRPQGEVPAPCGKRQKQDDRGEAQGLHGEIGEDRAPRPKHIARRGLGRIVEARVVDRPGGEARPCRASNGDDAEAVAAKHELP